MTTALSTRIEPDLQALRLRRMDIPGTTSFTEWCEMGEMLAALDTSLPWWIGDWAAFGEAKFGEASYAAMPPGHVNKDTMNTYAWVARRIPPVERVALSFTHHRLVAGLPKAQRVRLLKRALEGSWGTRELRAALPQKKLAEGDGGVATPSITPGNTTPSAGDTPSSTVQETVVLAAKVRCPACGHKFHPEDGLP